jgi:hypothetical protein
VRLYLFILIFFTVEEEGAEVKVFFFSFIGHVQRGGEGGLVFNPKSKERKKGKKPLLLLLLNWCVHSECCLHRGVVTRLCRQ